MLLEVQGCGREEPPVLGSTWMRWSAAAGALLRGLVLMMPFAVGVLITVKRELGWSDHSPSRLKALFQFV